MGLSYHGPLCLNGDGICVCTEAEIISAVDRLEAMLLKSTMTNIIEWCEATRELSMLKDKDE